MPSAIALIHTDDATEKSPGCTSMKLSKDICNTIGGSGDHVRPTTRKIVCFSGTRPYFSAADHLASDPNRITPEQQPLSNPFNHNN